MFRVIRFSKPRLLRLFSSHHGKDGHDSGHGHDAHVDIPILHTPDKVNLAANWPHELFDPETLVLPTNKSGVAYPPNPSHIAGVEKAYQELASGHIPEATFATPFWTRLLTAVFLGVVGYRLNESLYPPGTPHPITNLIAKLSAHEPGLGSVLVDLEDQESLADETIILKRESVLMKPRLARMRYDGVFERHSAALHSFGSDVDTDGVVIKHDYQEFDRFK